MNGVTRTPTASVAPVKGALPISEERRRVKQFRAKQPKSRSPRTGDLLKAAWRRSVTARSRAD
jgi:hypothetical protein